MSKGGLSVVVICWNGASDVERCLEALCDTAPERPYELHLVDNGSTDASVALARRFEPTLRVHELRENRGFSGAANEGARSSSSRLDYLLFLNTDVTARSGSLETLASFLDDHPEAAAATGRLVDASGEPQRGFNVRRLPTVVSQALELLLLHRLLPRNRTTRRHLMTDFDYETIAEVEQPAGACFAIRRDVLREVGGFDERFQPAWFEDVDLCRRLHDAGRRIFFVPDALFEHRGGASLEQMPHSRFLSIWYRNMLLYFEKHHGRRARLLRWLVGLGMLERMALSAFRPRRCKAYWRVFREAFWASPVS